MKKHVPRPFLHDPLVLCYGHPARESRSGWENQALPIGNGFLGAKVFGGVTQERIQFNDKTLWSGGPGVSGYDSGNTMDDNGKTAVEIYTLLKNGKQAQAARKLGKLQGNMAGFGDFQNFGDFVLKFRGIHGAENYVRSLDLRTAIAGVSFSDRGTTHTRECFVSYPDGVFVMRIASPDHQLRFSVRSAQGGSARYEGNVCCVSGSLRKTVTHKDGNGMRYGACFMIQSDGEITSSRTGIHVRHGNETVLILSAVTDYAPRYPEYRCVLDPLKTARRLAGAAQMKGYEALRRDHVADYRALFDRVTLDIGQCDTDKKTDELLWAYREGNPSAELESCYYQYGRYLMIASSREGGLPAGVQGVWKFQNKAPEGGGCRFDGRTELCYYSAQGANLTETAQPLLDYLDSIRKPGRITACGYFGIGSRRLDGRPNDQMPTGFLTNSFGNPFGFTGPGIDFRRGGWSPASCACLAREAYDYYAFTQDIDLLHDKIYPILQECALFWSQALVKDGAYFSPLFSYSPEHGAVTIGNTFDCCVIRELFRDTVRAAEALDAASRSDRVDIVLIRKLKEQMDFLRPIQIDRQGEIEECDEEGKAGTHERPKEAEDVGGSLAHLFGVFPGSQITRTNRELLQAARMSLENQRKRPNKAGASAKAGWHKAREIALWARLLDGEKALQALRSLLCENTRENLWDIDQCFQLAGNLGAVAGMTEMLLQSHAGYLDLLPALPKAWPDGKADGLCARGGFIVNLAWHNGVLSQAEIRAKAASRCQIYAPDGLIVDGVSVASDDSGIVSFEVFPGKAVCVSPGYEKGRCLRESNPSRPQ